MFINIVNYLILCSFSYSYQRTQGDGSNAPDPAVHSSDSLTTGIVLHYQVSFHKHVLYTSISNLHLFTLLCYCIHRGAKASGYCYDG